MCAIKRLLVSETVRDDRKGERAVEREDRSLVECDQRLMVRDRNCDGKNVMRKSFMGGEVMGVCDRKRVEEEKGNGQKDDGGGRGCV